MGGNYHGVRRYDAHFVTEKLSGNDRFATIVGWIANSHSVIPVIALLTGAISVYSSTSGVVLPAFLPMC